MTSISRLNMWIFLFILILIVGFLFFGDYLAHRLNSGGVYNTQVRVGKTKIWVQVADNMAKRYQGLSYRDEMCNDCGMLFVFKRSARPGFVMRGMRFALDFVWIDKGQVVGTTTGVEPGSKRIYTGQSKYNWVLELNSGFVEKNGIKPGDRVVLKSR